VTNAILCDSRLSAFPVRPLSSLSPSLVTLVLLLFRSLFRVLPLSVLFYTLPSSSCTLLSRFRYKRPVFIVACLLSLTLLTSALTSRELSARNAILDRKYRNPPDSRNQVSPRRITRNTKHVTAFGLVDR